MRNASKIRALGDRLRELAYPVTTWLVLAMAAYYAVDAYRAGFATPLLDRHAFRQTQTAITAYWMSHGGGWLAYETPVFGAPYSVPFEFPLYQWVVVLVQGATKLPLDLAGRAVSIGFFVATTVPFYRLLRGCDVPPAAARLGVAVLLTTPLYLYWTRTFLVESTALFFSVSALSIGVEILESKKVDARLVWLLVSATLAMLVKVTTGFAYLLALGLVFVQRFVEDPERRSRLADHLKFATAAFVLPAIPLLLWTRYADHLKRQNALIADFLTSSALHDWNFGTTALKLDPLTWRVLWDRTMVETFGASIGFAAFAAIALVNRRRVGVLVYFCVGILGTYAVFTSLHVVHDYYQYSTAALAVAVVGLGFGAAEAATTRAKILLPLAAAAMVMTSVRTYASDYRPAIDLLDYSPQNVAAYVRTHTNPSDLIVIYGNDWSSVIPYYAERRALMDRWGHGPSHPDIRRTLERSAALGHRVGAVLECDGERFRGPAWPTQLLGHPAQCVPLPRCVVCR